MKYKITKIVHNQSNKKGVVEFSTLYDFGIFCEKQETALVPYKKKEGIFRKLSSKLSRFMQGVAQRVGAFVALMRKRFLSRKENKMLLPALLGALTAASLVMLISFGIVGYKLFFRDIFARYTVVYVPDLTDVVYPSGTELLDTELYELEVSYEYSDDIPNGKVISQTPAPNVARKVYAKNGCCKVDIVVSLGKKTYTMPSLAGSSLRDARLALKNEGVKFRIEKKYSNDVPSGKLISTSPEPNVSFFADDTVTLYVSVGVKTVYRTAPELVGMDESGAREIISRMGLSIGSVTYESSELPYGTVISQSPAAYSRVKDKEKISLRVSAGQRFSEKKIPSLYGLSVDEAREKLALVGLVIGNIYAVANAAPSGTVVAQSLLPEMPVPSDVYSVDIYVSS